VTHQLARRSHPRYLNGSESLDPLASRSHPRVLDKPSCYHFRVLDPRVFAILARLLGERCSCVLRDLCPRVGVKDAR